MLAETSLSSDIRQREVQLTHCCNKIVIFLCDFEHIINRVLGEIAEFSEKMGLIQGAGRSQFSEVR